MSWSIRLGRFLGIDVYIHATFWLLIAFVGFSDFARTQEVSSAISGVLFILVLFGCVVLHEYGHALTARRFGIKTRDITLLPIGGLARLERLPSDPKQELLVALAGPAVNVVIALLLGIYMAATATLFHSLQLDLTHGDFVQRLFSVNIMLVLFNLLPAFPMDGGRVLRAILALRLPYVRATQIAATVGQGMALLFALVGLLSGAVTLLLIAFFVWIGAGQESTSTQARSAFAGVPVRGVMMTEFRTLHPSESLGQVTLHILRGSQQDFPVVDEHGNLVGLLTRAEFLQALEEHGEMAPVGSAMSTHFCTFEENQMLEPVFNQLAEGNCRTAPVTRNGRLVGLLTTENVGEYLMIHSALQSRRSHTAAAV